MHMYIHPKGDISWCFLHITCIQLCVHVYITYVCTALFTFLSKICLLLLMLLALPTADDDITVGSTVFV